ncbi:MAG: HEPN domain-containing protein, partial [Bacteroidia bacterium]
PSKRAPQVLHFLLNDFKANSPAQENFHQYYDRQSKDYFYQLLKPLADLTTLENNEYVDWGHEETFETAIGVGECAGVVIDLVATLLLEADEKLDWAKQAYANEAFADSIYHSYSVMISAAKSMLLDKGINSSTQVGVIKEFDNHFVQSGEISLTSSFSELVLQINKNEPSKAFAERYLSAATQFLVQINEIRG